MPNKTCCQDKAPVSESSKSLAELETMFFNINTGNTLSEQILSLNMLSVDMRLFLRLVQLRTAPDTRQPMYWAQPMLTQMMHLRLVDIRKLTEIHNKKDPDKHTLSFEHLIHLLKLYHADAQQRAFLNKVRATVRSRYNAHASLVNKYIAHAATEASRKVTSPKTEQTSVLNIWRSVLMINHVFYALFRYVQHESDMSPYPHTLRNHIHDMQRYFLLTEPETISLKALLDESIRDLDAIQSGTAPAPWETATS